MTPPTVSVLIVNWNRGDLLRLAVQSMLNQTWRDLEVVVVDNGSSDGSIAALQRAVDDPRLRYELLPENRGIADGINHGVKQCAGRFIALMDSDDVCDPRRIELQMAALAAEPALSGVGCDARLVDEAGHPFGELRLLHAPDDIRLYAAYNMPLHHPSLLLRREIFDVLQYRNPFVLSSDFDFITRAVEAGHRFAALPLLLCDYRRHTASSTVARADYAKLSTAVVRIASARRAAGRPEDVAGLKALVERWSSAGTPVWRAYLELAAASRRERAHVVACLHAALAVREKPGWQTATAYLWSLMLALTSEPRAVSLALEGVTKGPFWLLLKRKGFPAFPRY